MLDKRTRKIGNDLSDDDSDDENSMTDSDSGGGGGDKTVDGGGLVVDMDTSLIDLGSEYANSLGFDDSIISYDESNRESEEGGVTSKSSSLTSSLSSMFSSKKKKKKRNRKSGNVINNQLNFSAPDTHKSHPRESLSIPPELHIELA